jgi:hypothetical protein
VVTQAGERALFCQPHGLLVQSTLRRRGISDGSPVLC